MYDFARVTGASTATVSWITHGSGVAGPGTRPRARSLAGKLGPRAAAHGRARRPAPIPGLRQPVLRHLPWFVPDRQWQALAVAGRV